MPCLLPLLEFKPFNEYFTNPSFKLKLFSVTVAAMFLSDSFFQLQTSRTLLINFTHARKDPFLIR